MFGASNPHEPGEVILAVSVSALRRYGLAHLLKSPSTCVLEASSIEGAITELDRQSVDVALLELGSSGRAGIDAVARIHGFRPQVRILAITSSPDRYEMIDVLKAGAQGYISEAETPHSLNDAVRALLEGETYMPPSLAPTPPQSPARDGALMQTDVKLSGRQRQLLPLIAQGLSNKEIAQQLDISVSTAKFHVGTLLRSLNSSNRTEAAGKATLLLRLPKSG